MKPRRNTFLRVEGHICDRYGPFSNMYTFIIALNTVPEIHHHFLHAYGIWENYPYFKHVSLEALGWYIFGFITHEKLFL